MSTTELIEKASNIETYGTSVRILTRKIENDLGADCAAVKLLWAVSEALAEAAADAYSAATQQARADVDREVAALRQRKAEAAKG
jgi:hypothetical protein